MAAELADPQDARFSVKRFKSAVSLFFDQRIKLVLVDYGPFMPSSGDSVLAVMGFYLEFQLLSADFYQRCSDVDP